MTSLIFNLCVLLSIPNIQQNPDSLQAEEHYAAGMKLSASDYKGAAQEFKKAADLYGTFSPALRADALNRLASSFMLDENYDSGIEAVNEAEELVKENEDANPKVVVSIHMMKAHLLNRKGLDKESKKYFDLAIEKHAELLGGEDGFLSTLYTYRASYFYNKSQYAKSMNDFQNALRINLNIGADSLEVGINYNNLSVVYQDLDDFLKALEYANLSLAYKSGVVGEWNPTNAYTNINLGNISQVLGNYEDASLYFRKALNIRKRYSPELPSIGMVYYSLAELNGMFLSDELGVQYADSCIQHFLKYGTSLRITQAYLLKAKIHSNLAKVSDVEKNVAKSEEALENLLPYIEKFKRPTNHWNMALARADNESVKQNYTGALEMVNRAIRYNCINTALGANPEPKDFSLDGSALIEMMAKKIEILVEKARVEDSQTSIDEVGETVVAFDKIFNVQLFNIQSAKSRRVLLELLYTSYQKVFNLYFEKGLSDQAFYMVSLSKDKQAKYDAILSATEGNDERLAELFDTRKSIVKRINEAKSELLSLSEDQYDSLTGLQLRDSLMTLSREDEKLIKTINELTLIKSDLVYEKDKLPALEDDDILVDYYQTDDDIYACVVFQGSLNIYKVSTNENVDRLLARLKSEDKDQYASNGSFQLYKTLLSFLSETKFKELNTLTISPDGALWNLDFDLLLTEKAPSDDLKQLPFLLKKYATRYVYSSDLNSNSRKRKANRKPLLAFSFGEDEENGDKIKLETLRNSTTDLPGSLAEIKAISNLLEGDYYYGVYANEKQFKDVAADYQILHMAVHGETDKSAPENSRLFFYAEGDSLEDAKLHAFELYEMDLNADLAVLSACNTGTGDVVEGEGVVSMGKAFAHAGVNSLVLSRREISDAVSPEIMKTFYEELNAGKRKSEALRLAKLKFLEDSNNINSDPQLWSAFYILGDDSPIDFDGSSSRQYWIFFIALGLTVLIVSIRKKHSKSS